MSQRAVVNRPANVRFVIEDDAGDVLAADAPGPGVTVLDLDGASAGSGTAVPDGTGYRFGLSRAALGPVTAAWSAAVGGVPYSGTEAVRFVSRRAVPMSRLRGDQLLGTLSTLDFIDAVGGAEDALEAALRFRIVTTLDRISVEITRPQRVLRLGPHYLQRVVAAKRDGVALDVSTIEVRADALELPTAGSWDFLTGWGPSGTWAPGRYTFDVEHGLIETPADIQRAVLLLARHNAPGQAAGAYPDRASKIISAETEIWFSRRSPDSYFGIPEVDDVVCARRLDLPIQDNTSF
jgi:hypothetical protein